MEKLPLDLSGLEVEAIDVLSADSIVMEGHGAIETGASSAMGYCSSYMQANSCWAPEA
ncbi:hypothetical protein ABT352_23640 [Streptosporangium sp. NPDC000563]|uniref:hypothetical protein n=1 Tax=unclassified Streptosporangium TaxID=2632669 RepID=UPI0033216D88